MNFSDAIKVCFNKYADFNGRAKRPELWWFILFTVLVSTALSMVSDMLSVLFSLAVLLPSLAAGARRLHDTNRSGWLQLILLIPIIGAIIMIVLLAQASSEEDNQYGPVPTR